MTTPKTSQAFGLVVSGIGGIITAIVLWTIIAYGLDFWYIGDVLGPVIGLVGGCIAAFELFTIQLREVPLNWVGISRFLGKPTGGIYENGVHWVFPSFSILNVPGPTLKFIIMMPEEKINAQDGALIYFGVDDEPKKRNRVQYSVTDPIAYIATDDPEDELREAYLEQARLFFSQAASPIGVKNEKTLFSDFVMLPPRDAPEASAMHTRFRERLDEVRYSNTGAVAGSSEPLFNEGSKQTIMDNAGEFLQNAAKWGIGNILAFTPNVRANPETETAAAKKQEEREAADSLKTKAENVTRLATEMAKDAKVSPDLAATLVAALGGQGVTVQNTTFTLSGIPEVLRVLGERLIPEKEKRE